MYLFLLFSLGFFLPLARAQSATPYVQPMCEIHWTTRTLLVSIPTSPQAWRDAILQAMGIWNRAQTWFIQTYEPNHPADIYTLQEAQPGQTAQIVIHYVNSLPNGWSGQTTHYGVQIEMVQNYVNVVLAAHELGHSLGLGDNSISGDLERNNYVYTPYPSTLNLYGVFLQAQCSCYTGEEQITLPAQIPYAIYWDTPVPEFSNILPVLVVMTFFGYLLRPKRR